MIASECKTQLHQNNSIIGMKRARVEPFLSPLCDAGQLLLPLSIYTEYIASSFRVPIPSSPVLEFHTFPKCDPPFLKAWTLGVISSQPWHFCSVFQGFYLCPTSSASSSPSHHHRVPLVLYLLKLKQRDNWVAVRLVAGFRTEQLPTHDWNIVSWSIHKKMLFAKNPLKF